MEHVLSKRSFDKDGFMVIVKRILDEDPDTSYLTREYTEESPEDRANYKAQDAERLKGLQRGNWHFIGITIEVRKQTKTQWANGGLEVGRASVWGYESDSEEAFLKSEEESLIKEAFAEVDRLREALCR